MAYYVRFKMHKGGSTHYVRTEKDIKTFKSKTTAQHAAMGIRRAFPSGYVKIDKKRK